MRKTTPLPRRHRHRCSSFLYAALGAALLAGPAGCKGEAGITGPAGSRGPEGPTGNSCTVADNGDGTRTVSCEDGTTVTLTDGQQGTSCTVVDNGDGTKTVSCDDGTSVIVSDGQAGASCAVVDNGDGTKTISCPDGTSVTVTDGQTGGSCTVTDNGNGTKTIACSDGTTVTVVDGVTVATVDLHVTDADNRADVIGATVTLAPGSLTATTGVDGRATVTGVPAGVYQISASAPSLTLSGSAVVQGPARTASIASISIVAGVTLPLALALDRIDERLNLVAIHTGGNLAFVEANCEACHNDREDEESADPAEKPYHALPMHALMDCTFCHQTVDLTTRSGATIRKQVDVTTTCAPCHPSYPAAY